MESDNYYRPSGYPLGLVCLSKDRKAMKKHVQQVRDPELILCFKMTLNASVVIARFIGSQQIYLVVS